MEVEHDTSCVSSNLDPSSGRGCESSNVTCHRLIKTPYSVEGVAALVVVARTYGDFLRVAHSVR